MMNLIDSIKENGILTPATVRKKEDGRYEMISGHRRMRASKLAGLETLRCEVVEMDRDSATVYMVDSNMQRTMILPSEKAFSYKLRLDAMKRQGKRTDLTSSPMGTKLQGVRSDELLAKEVGDSRNQVQRYIRLTSLIPELLDLVDENKIALRPAVEISYLTDEFQYNLLDEIEMGQCTPSHAQAIKLRKMYAEGKLNADVITSIMEEEKPNQREKFTLGAERVKKLLPKDLPKTQTEEYIIKALEFYSKHREKQKQRDDSR